MWEWSAFYISAIGGEKKKKCGFPLRDNDIFCRAVPSSSERFKVANNPHDILKSCTDAALIAFPVLSDKVQRISPKNTTREMILFLFFAQHCSLLTIVFLCVPGAVLAALNNVPSNLPSDIVKMDLSRNNIQHLRPKQFLLSKDLKLLNLSSNSLRHIDTGEANAQNHRSPWQQSDVLLSTPATKKKA